jgi:hypothetical protein
VSRPADQPDGVLFKELKDETTICRGVKASEVENGVARETRPRLQQCVFRSRLFVLVRKLWAPSVPGKTTAWETDGWAATPTPWLTRALQAGDLPERFRTEHSDRLQAQQALGFLPLVSPLLLPYSWAQLRWSLSSLASLSSSSALSSL